MHLRRSFAALAVTTVTAVPLLASCGFDANTDRPNTPATGTYDNSGPVKVVAAVVVSSAEGEGTFIATLSNAQQTETATFDGVQGAEGNAVVPGESEPIEIPPGDYVNLADEGGVKLTGSFAAGDTLPLSLDFGDGSDVTLVVPVVRACAEYAGLDPAASEPASAEPSVSPTDAPETVEPTAPDAELSGSASAEEQDDAEADPYTCTSTAEEE
jgi:hypothetical protein